MSFLPDLIAILGSRNVLTRGLEAYTSDWTRGFGGPCSAVVKPTDAHQVAQIVRLCRQFGIGLVPQGGNTGLVGSSVPGPALVAGEHPPIVLNMSRMNHVEVVGGSQYVIAEAGATLAEVQQAAVAADRIYGVDLAAREQATIGGTIATNAGGVRVCAYGMTRDQVLSLEYVLGTGEVVTGLRPLVKDNTGYDLDQLICGSEGTLAVVTRAALRLLPKQGPSTLIGVAVDGIQAAGDIAIAARSSEYQLLAAEVVDGVGWARAADVLGVGVPFDARSGVALLLEFADGGSGDGVPQVLRNSPDLVVALDPGDQRRLWRVRESQSEVWSRMGLVHKFDVSVPSEVLGQLVQSVMTLAASIEGIAEIGYFGHLSDGNLHFEVVGGGLALPVLTASLLGVVADLGGSISAEHGIGRAKVEHLHLRRSTAEMAAMRGIKSVLDPDGILNPGVLFSS